MVRAPQSSLTVSVVEYLCPSCYSAVYLVMLTSYYFVFSILQTLWGFGTTFCRPNPLFSSPYRLFWEKTGGEVNPKAAVVQLFRTLGRTPAGARDPLCLGYSRYLLPHQRCVTLCQRNAPAPDA